jgi:hypothetical protein
MAGRETVILLDAGFMSGLFFDPEEGREMFLRNIN